MPSNNDDVLLRIKGDASDAQRAAAQAGEAIGQVEQRATRASGATQAAGEQMAGALSGAGQAASQAGDAVGGLGDQAGGAAPDVNVLARVVGRFNPQLGMLADLATKARQAMATLLSPVGLAGAALVAAIYAVIAAVRELKRQGEEARRALEQMHEARDRRQAGRAEQVESVAEAIARAGVTDPQAVERMAALARRAEKAGHAPEAVRTVLPLIAAGLIDEDDLARHAAQAERFGPDTYQFDRHVEMPGAARRAEARARHRQPEIDAQLALIEARAAREREAVTEAEPHAIRARLQRLHPQFASWDAERQEEVVRRIRSVSRTGTLDWEREGLGGWWASAKDQGEAREEAIALARLAGAITPERERAIREGRLGHPAPTFSPTLPMPGVIPVDEPSRSRSAPQPTAQPTPQQQPDGGVTINENYYGWTFKSGSGRRNEPWPRR